MNGSYRLAVAVMSGKTRLWNDYYVSSGTLISTYLLSVHQYQYETKKRQAFKERASAKITLQKRTIHLTKPPLLITI